MRSTLDRARRALRPASWTTGILLLATLQVMACGGGGGADGPTTPPTPTPDNTPRVLGVSITPANASAVVGETVQLTAAVSVQNGASQGVSWSSGNTAVATVASGGLVTAVAAGTATITAVSTVDPSRTATATVVVSPAPAPTPAPTPTPQVNSVTVSPSTLTLYVGDQATLTPTVSVVGGAATTVTWSSSVSTVAGVSASGVVTAAAQGSATVRATSTADPGKFFDVSVSVIAQPYDPGYPRTIPPGERR